MLCWTRYLLLGLLILVLVFTLVEVALLLMRQGGFQSERGEKEEGHSVLLLWLQQLAQQTDAAFYPPQQQAASSPPLDGYLFLSLFSVRNFRNFTWFFLLKLIFFA